MKSRWYRFGSAVFTLGIVVACSKGGSVAEQKTVGTPPDLGGGSMQTGGTVPDTSGLPTLPLMTHVTAVVRGNGATIGFDPVAGAKDYRAYLLPDKADVRLNADGSFDGINNAVYRCAGQRASTGVWIDSSGGPGSDPVPDWISVDTQTDGKTVGGYARPLTEATLGYVFQDAQPGTVPVYAVGDTAAAADNYVYGIRDQQTRAKLYVTDRSSYVAKGWRDDGVVFYAPDSATSTACGTDAPVAVHTVDNKEQVGVSHLYYVAPGEIGKRGAGTTPFFVCPAAVGSSQPLMRTFYRIRSPGGSFGSDGGHDELALGAERFARARCQGSTFGACTDSPQSLWEVQWSNITAPVTLVVEALDAGCPFQGLMAASPLPSLPVASGDNNGDASLMNDALFTFAQIQAKAPHGEVFINGQYDAASKPHPIARAALTLAPQPRPPMDFASDFAGSPELFTEVLAADGSPDCGLTADIRKRANNPDTCDGAHRMTSPTYDALLMDVDDKHFTAGVIAGELWSGYSGGKFRFTPKTATATISDSTYIHAAMEVSSFSTGRRYPQMIIQQLDMISGQWLLERTPADTTNTNVMPAVYLHTIDAGIGRHVLELELCNNRQWQVNNHCPWFLLEKEDPPSAKTVGTDTAHPALFDRLQDDRNTRFDLFLSTEKAYVYVDSIPYGCVDIAHRKPTTTGGATISPSPIPPPAGPVTVIFGDVLYHSGAESGYFQRYSEFHLNHLLYETVRHFEYVAFKSNEPAPAWDETATPCVTQMHQGGGAGTQTPEEGN